MISIALTTYNGEKYITEQLNSFLEQTRKPDEIVIVDDCSTDGTLKILFEFKQKYSYLFRIKIIQNITNLGYIKSFYISLKNTSGDIIFLSDQDDIWLKNKIEIMSDTLLGNTNILVLNSKFQKVDSKNRIIKSYDFPFFSNHNLIKKVILKNKISNIKFNSIVKGNISPGCTMAMKSVILNDFYATHINESNLAHDWELNLKAARVNKLYFLNSVTTSYRIHENNTIGLKRLDKVDAKIKQLKNFFLMREDQLRLLISINTNNELNNNINLIKNKINITLMRIENLQKRNLIKSFLLLTNFKTILSNSFLGVLEDTFLILKEKHK